MLTDKEIKSIVSNVTTIFKNRSSNYTLNKSKKDDFYTGYLLACEYMERVSTHSDIGGFPERLFSENAPNESDKEKDYIRGNFKQTTLQVYLDYHSSMLRMWNDNDWYMEFTPDEDKFKEQSMQQYVENEIRVFGSLENFFKSSLMHLRDVDANGVLAVKPYEIIKTFDDGSTETITETELYEPQPYYYRCDQVVSKEYDKYYLILLDEKSLVSYGDQKRMDGLIYELYDDQNIWRITQTGKQEDYKFKFELYFNHAEGVIPCMELRGVPQIIKGKVIWQSKFLYACDLLDVALVVNNYLRATHSNVCFPYRVMLGNRCMYEYTDANNVSNYCNKGKVYDSKQGHDITCPACKGAGLIDRVNRMGQMLIEPDTTLKQGDGSQVMANAMYYVSPETSALDFSMKLEEKTTDQARSVLHLKNSSTKVQPNASGDTAIGDTLDQKAMTAFIKPESVQVFSLFQFTTDRIGWQRYASDYKPVYFKYPNNFDTVSDSDYLKRISALQVANAPTVLIEAEIDKYIQSLYYNEKDSQDRYRLIAQADRLFFLSQTDINLKLNGKNQTVDKWESILHDSSTALIDMLVIEHEADESNVPEDNCIYPYVCTPMKGFFSNDFQTQKELLIAKAKEVTDAIKSATPPPLNTNSVIDNIVKSASATAAGK